MADKAGLEYIAYEAGHGGGMPKNKLCDAYTYALEKLRPILAIDDELTFVDQWGTSTYSCLEYATQPLSDAPKYRAIVDFAEQYNNYVVASLPEAGHGMRAFSTSNHIVEPYVFDLAGRKVITRTPAAPAHTVISPGLYIQRNESGSVFPSVRKWQSPSNAEGHVRRRCTV